MTGKPFHAWHLVAENVRQDMVTLMLAVHSYMSMRPSPQSTGSP